MDFFRNAPSERYIEGVISCVNDDIATIELKMGVGVITLPKKYIISDNEIKPGQVVGLLMSFPEVVFDGVDDKHVSESKDRVISIEENILKAAS